MRTLSVMLLLGFAAGTMRPALAGERGPVCRQPTVVDVITREVRAQNYYSWIDAGLITEQPTADPHVVQCQVCVQSAPYSMIRFGDRPVGRCLERGVAVRILPNGFVVDTLQ